MIWPFKYRKEEGKFENWIIRKYVSHLPLIDLFVEAKYGKNAAKTRIDELKKEIEKFMQEIEKIKDREKSKS